MGQLYFMTAKQKTTAAIALGLMVFALVGGLALTAVDIAWGIFFSSAALMLSPFAGMAMLAGVRFLRASGLVKAFFGVGGVLLLAAIALFFVNPSGTGLPMLIGGATCGIAGLCLFKPRVVTHG
ncbi:hypothetical protein CCONF_00490 [Corynebacterium confusum]|nr:hypothetical protein CCONF_00490 [Corynebacterium confusum]